MRTYSEALAYLNQFINYERTQPQRYAPETLSLDRVNRLLDRLGRPDRAYQAIHVAGTKGKGSTAAMIESCLRAAGYRTGFYISPHLHTFRERMRVNNEYVSQAAFARLVDELEPHLKSAEGITWFEIVTTLAFMFFAREQIDVAVLEVGMGGRFDATNVVTPVVSVITSLSLDHMNLLGNTLEQIAFEKAGIIKRHVPVVSAPQAPEALDVIRRVTRLRSAPLAIIGRNMTIEPLVSSLTGIQFLTKPPHEHAEDLPSLPDGTPRYLPDLYRIPLLGMHQLTNAGVAIAALRTAAGRGLPITAEAIHVGLATVKWPGRLEVLSYQPLVVVDGAHNGDSAQKLAEALRSVFHIGNWTLIIGISADKDIPAILAELLPVAQRVIVTRASNSRAASLESLREQIAKQGYEPTLADNVGAALEIALTDQQPIIVTGSLFTVADAREAWLTRQGLLVEKD